MEIGLRAKVKPDVDDRAVRNEAGRLRSSFEEALEDLEVAVDLSDVVDRMDSAQDHVEEMSTETHRAATGVSEMKDAMESMDLSALEQMQEGDFGMDVLFGDGPAQMGGGQAQAQAQQDPGMLQQGMQSLFGGVGDRARGRTGQMSQGISGKLDSMNGTLGRIGKGLLAGAAVVAVGGLALQYLSDTVDALASTSPLLETVVSMFGLAMSLFFRPFASMLGSLLLPIAASALQLAAEFNTVFGEEGIDSALGFLATEIVAGIVSATLSVDIIGGLMGAGEMTLLGGDKEFGIADVFRIAILGAIGKVAIGRILSKGILSMLPRITATRLINVFAFPKLGTFIANRLGSILMKASITEILEAGFRQLLQRAFGPVVANASFKTLWQAAFATLRSKIPSLGITAFLGRLIPNISGKGLMAALSRALPKIGVSSLLKRVGLSAVLKLLTGRLAYAIPVIGQIIGVIDLLTMIITALIPGMEMFSPINWILVQTWNLLKWIAGGLMDVGGWIMGGIMDGFEWLATFDWASLIPSMGDVEAAGSAAMAGALDVLKDIWSWILSALDPVASALAPVTPLLGLFAALAIQGWNMLMGFLEDPGAALSGAFGGAMDLGSMAIDELITGSIDIWNWVTGGSRQIWDWVAGSSRDIWYWISGKSREIWVWITSSTREIWDWVTNTSASIWDYVSTKSRAIWYWIVTTGRDIWFWVTNSSEDIWNWVTDTSEDIWNWVSDTSHDIWNWITDATMEIWDFVSSAMMSLWAFVSNKSMAIWEFVSNTSKSIWDYVTNFSKSIWSFVTGTTMSIWDFVSSTSQEIWDWVTTPSINLRDYINIPEIDLGDHISVPDISLTQSGDGDGGGGWTFTGLASGGIVTGPTTALIGEGSESEAVLPLSRLESMMSTPSMPSPPSVDTGGEQSVTVDVNAALDVSEDSSQSDIATELEAVLGSQLSQISASVDELARKIQNSRLNGDITITADGKVLAEVDSKGTNKYKRTRDVTK